jgi:adenylate kinase family enzyme
MFEKRYKEYLQENEEIVRKYRERGLLVEVDTGKVTEESWEKLSSKQVVSAKRSYPWPS